MKADCPQKPKTETTFFALAVCDFSTDLTEAQEAYLSMDTEDKKVRWLLDGGATTHITMCEGIVSNFTENANRVTVANNVMVKSHGSGSLTMKQKGTDRVVRLDHVEVIPEFAMNIISLGRLTEEGSGYHFVQKGNEAYVEREDGARLTFVKHPVKPLLLTFSSL